MQLQSQSDQYTGVMGALQARFVFIAFVGLSALIAYNAMYLQDGPQKVRFSADVKSLHRDARWETASIGRARAPRQPLMKSDTVRAVQEQLQAKGYDPGTADGVHGLLTRAAVMAWQDDQGVTATGEVSDALLKQIIFGSAAREDDDAKKEIPADTVALIKAVQQILAKMGYDPGPLDGIMGATTRRAIKGFEEQHKLPVKGRVSGSLLKALAKVTGANLASIQAN